MSGVQASAGTGATVNGTCYACGRAWEAATVDALASELHDHLLTEHPKEPATLVPAVRKAEARPWQWRAGRHGHRGPAAGRAHQIGDLTLDERHRMVRRGGTPVWLTPVEFQLLCHLMGSAGRVAPRHELIATVWGRGGCSENLLERHLANLRRKLHAHGPPVLRTVRGAGYVLDA